MKTMLVDGIEVTMEQAELSPEEAEEFSAWRSAYDNAMSDPDGSARNVDGTPYIAAANDGKAMRDPDRNPDGTFKVGCSQAITKQTAKELQRRSVISRKANKVTKTRQVLLKEVRAIASPDYTIDTWEDAWAFMAGVLVKRGTHLDTKLSDAVKVFRAIGKAVDAFPDKTPLTIRKGKQAISGSVEEVYNLLMQAKARKEENE